MELVRANFILTPKGMIDTLKLRRPIYRKTAAFGHFGRTEDTFTWEATDKAHALKEAAQPAVCGPQLSTGNSVLVEGCKHALEITVPVAEVDQETERAPSHIQEKVRLPGFRPGKAPLSHRQDPLRRRYPPGCAGRPGAAFPAGRRGEGQSPGGRPAERSPTSIFTPGEPLRFKAEFEVAPTFELGEYRGVTITYDEPEVTDADVDERVEQIRDQKAQYVNEEPRALADGDYAVVSLESLEGVEEKVSQDELMLKIGDEATMKAFSENLRGASPEDVREFDVTYPEDYDRKPLAGKTVKFHAVVKAVRRKELPELNDEFAKDLGDFQTLDELKETIRKSSSRSASTTPRRKPRAS